MAAAKFNLKFLLDATDHASSVFGRVESRGKRMGKALAGVGSALTAGLTVPILAAGVASTRAALNFEQSMGNISTLIDTDTESMQALGDGVLATSKKLRGAVALNELPSALYDIRSASISAQDQFRVLEGSGKLAAAGLGTVQEATSLATGAINAWQLKGEEAGAVFNTIFQTVKAGKTTISELSQGFGGVAGMVASANISTKEYFSSVAALTRNNMKAAEAHTSMKQVLSNLIKPSTDAKKVLDDLGMGSLPEMIEQAGGLVPALQKINGALGGNQTKLAKVFGSVEAFNAVLALTGSQAEGQREILQGMTDDVTALDEAFDKQTRTSAAQLQRLKNGFQEVGIKLGTALLPVLQKIADKVESAIEWFDKLSDSDKKLAAWGVAAAAALGPVLLVAGKLATAFSTIRSASALKSLTKAGGAAGKMGGALGGCCCGPSVPKGGSPGGAPVGGAKGGAGGLAGRLGRFAPVAATAGMVAVGAAGAYMAARQIGDKHAAIAQQRAISDEHQRANPLAFSGIENPNQIQQQLGTSGDANAQQPLQLSPEFLKKAGVSVDAESARAIGEATAQAQAKNPVKTEVLIDVRNLPAGAQVRATSTADATETRVGRATEGS